MRYLRSVMVLVCLFLSLSACNPTPTATSTPFATVTPSNDFSISVTPIGGAGLPAGSSASFTVELKYPANQVPQSVIWETQNLAQGIHATILGATTPWNRRLLVTTDVGLAAGSYGLDVAATVNSAQKVAAGVQFTVAACTETASGSSTQAINSNLVELITAGKPAVEHGLLVPVQICANQRHLSVHLTSATAEDGSNMSTLPSLYVFRSEVWPAPDHIIAHGLTELFNVQVPTVAQSNSAGQLDADVGAGLYLLIFERDRYAATLTPERIPASVTYEIGIQ